MPDVVCNSSVDVCSLRPTTLAVALIPVVHLRIPTVPDECVEAAECWRALEQRLSNSPFANSVLFMRCCGLENLG